MGRTMESDEAKVGGMEPTVFSEKNFPAESRRWAILIRHHLSGEMMLHHFHHAHFPSEEDSAREAMCQVAPQVLPVLMGKESLRELLATQGFSVVWVQEVAPDAERSASPIPVLKDERPQD